MHSACSVSGSDVIVVRLGWFFHTRLKGSAERISAQTKIARGTLRRYMEYDPQRIARGSGPQKIPHILRIIEALEVNPAKLAAALYYAEDEATFRRLMSAALCIEEKLAVQIGGRGRPKMNPRVIRLDPDDGHDDTDLPSQPIPPGRMRGRFQERLAWYVAERIRGRHDELTARTGIPQATLRRYGIVDGAAEGRTGPQKIRTFLKLLEALQVSPAKLAIAAHYSGDDDSFWAIMSSTICVEERLNFRGHDGRSRRRRHLHRLDDSPGLLSQFPLAARGNGKPVD